MGAEAGTDIRLMLVLAVGWGVCAVCGRVLFGRGLYRTMCGPVTYVCSHGLLSGWIVDGGRWITLGVDYTA